MKKLFFICSFLLLSAVSFSQKVTGTFTLPEGEKFISIDWDWSDAVIDKKYNDKYMEKRFMEWHFFE